MSTALALVEPTSTAVTAPRVGLLRPIAAPADVILAQNETRALVTQALQKDRDYGVIPGTHKPTLYKAGAERVSLAFGCFFGAPEIVEREINHDYEVQYTSRGQPAVSYGLYRYVVRVPVVHRESGAIVGMGIGSCSTMESKYISRPRDCENTALKMAHKRALVGAALVTFGLSDEFTQDVEDMPRELLQRDGQDATPAAPAATAAPSRASRTAAAAAGAEPACPKCGGKMWDNREGKKNPKAPDFKCRDRSCDGVVWPPRGAAAPVDQAPPADEPPADFAPVDDDDASF